MKLNKKLMSVAVAGALAAPALAYAQASTVQLFGRVNVIYGYYDNGGAGSSVASNGTAPGTARVRTDAMSDSESEIGVRGEENVGGGLTVHFQCLSSFDVTGIRANAGTAGWCGRNSNAGLKGSFGNAFFGNYDVALKQAVINPFRVFALNNPMGLNTTYNGSQSGVDNGGTTVPSTATQSGFARRQNRSWHYWSPVVNGFQGFGTFSAANEATAFTSASTIQKPRLWSVAAGYNNGPFGVAMAYEKHKDYNAAVQANYTGGTDAAWILGAGYQFMGTLKVNLQYVHLDYQLAAGRGMTQNNWNVNGQWDIAGPHLIRVGYIAIGNTKGTAGVPGALIRVGQMFANGGAGDTGGSKILFEYGYNLSKRTELSLGYAKQSNDRFSNMSIGTGGITSANLGESQTYIGGRMSHRF